MSLNADDGTERMLQVRPYAITGGRTRGATELAIETILVLTPAGEQRVVRNSTEKGEILCLCATPTSVAELSANMRIPLGVVRVLAGDLCDEGLLDFNRDSDNSGRPNLRLLERVFDGLQAL